MNQAIALLVGPIAPLACASEPAIEDFFGSQMVTYNVFLDERIPPLKFVAVPLSPEGQKACWLPMCVALDYYYPEPDRLVLCLGSMTTLLRAPKTGPDFSQIGATWTARRYGRVFEVQDGEGVRYTLVDGVLKSVRLGTTLWRVVHASGQRLRMEADGSQVAIAFDQETGGVQAVTLHVHGRRIDVELPSVSGVKWTFIVESGGRFGRFKHLSIALDNIDRREKKR